MRDDTSDIAGNRNGRRREEAERVEFRVKLNPGVVGCFITGRLTENSNFDRLRGYN